MLLATDVQVMLGVDDLEIIAHGYTFDRDTVDIYFENGELVRRDWNEWKNRDFYQKSDGFDGSFFHNGIKRWYKDRTNQKVCILFETFNNRLDLT